MYVFMHLFQYRIVQDFKIAGSHSMDQEVAPTCVFILFLLLIVMFLLSRRLILNHLFSPLRACVRVFELAKVMRAPFILCVRARCPRFLSAHVCVRVHVRVRSCICVH